ncbi:MAG: amidohydrolase family protein [Gemmatimonadota bacterium]
MTAHRALGALLVLTALGCAEPGPQPPPDTRRAGPDVDSALTVIRAQRILDGRGGVLENRDIVIRNGVIEAITAPGERPALRVHDVGRLTVLPGLIDTHVHIGWHFDRTGRTQSSAVEETSEERAYYAAENAWMTLMGGVTTAQSLGSPDDLALRDALGRGVLPGPRVLTSIAPVTERTGSPAEIRAFVDRMAERGADVIKIFASASIRDGGAPTLSQEQLDAACGRARERGLRSVVHAHGPESAQRSARAGCTTVEHGALLDRATLELLAEQGTFFDPNIDLVFRNYLENKERYLGVGNYTEEGFAQMERALPLALAVFKEGLTTPGLRMVFGTDAVAGSHGRNWQELAYRVHQGGQDPMAAVISATSLAAESLGLGDRIGSIAPGMAADLIVTDGDPSQDIDALGRVDWVMVGGRMFRVDR